MKPTCLYIRGVPGSGKITVARILEQRLGYRLFWLHDLDSAIRTVCSRPIDAREVRSLLSEITKPIIEHLFTNQLNVIYVRPSGNIEVVENVKKRAERYGYRFVLVTLTAEYHTLIARVTGRTGWRLNSKEELEGYLASVDWPGMDGEIQIPTDNNRPEETAAQIEAVLRQKIVFTNGCFDVLHAGHVRLLREAKAQGDILVVGLNSDNSVRNLKGCGRPINDQQARKTVLSAIAGVDRIVIFEDEAELADVIRKLRPDVLVKGADWRNRTITGAEYAGRLHFVERHGTSTTATIERILAHAG